MKVILFPLTLVFSLFLTHTKHSFDHPLSLLLSLSHTLSPLSHSLLLSLIHTLSQPLSSYTHIHSHTTHSFSHPSQMFSFLHKSSFSLSISHPLSNLFSLFNQTYCNQLFQRSICYSDRNDQRPDVPRNPRLL